MCKIIRQFKFGLCTETLFKATSKNLEAFKKVFLISEI